jgi:DNA polymerase-4
MVPNPLRPEEMILLLTLLPLVLANAQEAPQKRKPDGLFVIQPEEVDQFLLPLSVGRMLGVGKVTEEKLKKFDTKTVGDLRKLDLQTLEGHFGRYGVRLYELARGVDNSQVIPDRQTQSVSAEDTFEHDVPLTETEPMIPHLAQKAWTASRKELRIPRTVVLKLKTSQFKIPTRSHTPNSPPSSWEELTSIALSLRDRVGLTAEQRFRLVGVGLSNFRDPTDASAQPALFE